MIRSIFAAVIVTLFSLNSFQLQAQQANLGPQMDNAIEMMRGAGNDQPKLIISMLNAGAQGYFSAGDMDKAIARIDEAISLARDSNQPQQFMLSMDIAARILSKKDDEAAFKFLTSQLRASADKVEFKKQVLKATRIQLMKAELVVLSACDTGRGVITGDGVIGLSQGYISAGVPTVVVSLWPVNDQATAVLMSYFYQAMLKGSDKATALRAAMMKTREKFPSPKLWAPFSITGVAE